MNATIQTIPELLIQTRDNQTEVARMLSCARGTVLKYNRDSKGERFVGRYLQFSQMMSVKLRRCRLMSPS
jgi:hypothetical protein